MWCSRHILKYKYLAVNEQLRLAVNLSIMLGARHVWNHTVWLTFLCYRTTVKIKIFSISSFTNHVFNLKQYLLFFGRYLEVTMSSRGNDHTIKPVLDQIFSLFRLPLGYRDLFAFKLELQYCEYWGITYWAYSIRKRFMYHFMRYMQAEYEASLEHNLEPEN